MNPSDARTVLHKVADLLADLLDERSASNPNGTKKASMAPRTQLERPDETAMLPAGMTINFEPIASADGQGFFLEDMYLITKEGSELLTSGVPYSAEQIEAEMR